jgi:hypothetical protein
MITSGSAVLWTTMLCARRRTRPAAAAKCLRSVSRSLDPWSVGRERLVYHRVLGVQVGQLAPAFLGDAANEALEDLGR